MRARLLIRVRESTDEGAWYEVLEMYQPVILRPAGGSIPHGISVFAKHAAMFPAGQD